MDRLRPLKVTEVVDRSFALYRDNLVLFYAIMGCVFVPFGTLYVALGDSLQKKWLTPATAPNDLVAYFPLGVPAYLLFMMATAFPQPTPPSAVAAATSALPTTFRPA